MIEFLLNFYLRPVEDCYEIVGSEGMCIKTMKELPFMYRKAFLYNQEKIAFMLWSAVDVVGFTIWYSQTIRFLDLNMGVNVWICMAFTT